MREEIPGDFERNLEAISRFRAAGNKFALATGRGLASVLRGFPNYREYVDYLVLDNGALCLGQNGVLFDYLIPEETARRLVNYTCEYAAGHRVGFTFYNSQGQESKELSGSQTKIRIWVDDDDFMGKMNAELSERFKQDNVIFFTGHRAALALIHFRPDAGYSCLLDATPAAAGKEAAIKRLSGILGDKEVITVGDGNNDLGMIQKFEGYIMSSAAPFLLAEVDESHHADSVAGLIDQLLEKH